MKKFLFAIFASSLLFFSCNSDKTAGSDGMSDAAQKNLESNRAVIKMFETGDFTKVGDYIAADAVDHAAGPMGQDIVGLDSIKANFNKFGQMMKDVKNEVVKELADDEYVMSWVKQSATAKTDIPEWHMREGQTMSHSAIEVTKYNKDNKVTDHWSFVSMEDAMKWMSEAAGGGATTQPDPNQPLKDTTSK